MSVSINGNLLKNMLHNNNIVNQWIHNGIVVWQNIIPGTATLSGTGGNMNHKNNPFIWPNGTISFSSTSATMVRSGNGVKFNESTPFTLSVGGWTSRNGGVNMRYVVQLLRNGTVIDTIYNNTNVPSGGTSISGTKKYNAYKNDIFSLRCYAGEYPEATSTGTVSSSGPVAIFRID